MLNYKRFSDPNNLYLETEDSSKTDGNVVVDNLETVPVRFDSSQKTVKMSNILPRREDSSKTGNLKIDEDS